MCTHTHIYRPNGILFSHEKEGNPATCNNMDAPGGYYAKQNNPDTERQIPFDLSYKWNPKMSNS